MLKENINAVKNAPIKKIAQEYYDKLETPRSKLLGTKQKSIFADEKKLREDISEVYSAVCFQETKPSTLQMERTQLLQQQIADAEKLNATINEHYYKKVKEAIAKLLPDLL